MLIGKQSKLPMALQKKIIKAKMKKKKAKKGIKFGGLAAIGAGGLYLAGAKKRRYKKAPKPGEGRDLRNQIVSQPDIRTYFK